ncbi:DUF488 domain-containing protein [Agrococcus casei]|uniref:Uroporphyrin-III c-methyltransferase n=1 Tax=Agrococcus casei LMG 22410 TaxID=1255656 RepID=A0A1R4G9R3_9MICO|nr:DUF488 family protein [Agrococcus casei]SJM64825.1 protein of unknown function YeaO [Agrococcus casei LMG 22410]
MTEFRTKRIYDDAAKADGHRVLVDRIWPRGIKKEDAGVDAWPKEIAPSSKLRKRFHSDDDYRSFKRDYNSELDDSDDYDDFVDDLKSHKTVTLLTAAKDPDRSHVSVLLDRLQ